MRLLKIWLIYSVSLVLGIVLILFIALAAVLSTQSGTRWALDKADSLLEAELLVPDFSGDLWRGLSVAEFTYRDDKLEIVASNLELALDWRVLLAGQITIDHVNSRSLVLRPLGPETEAQPFELSMDPSSLRLNVRSINIAQLEYRSGENPTTVTNIRGKNFALRSNRLGVDLAALDVGDIHVDLKRVGTRLGGDVPLVADVAWQLQDSPWSGQGELRGNLAKLEFRHLLHGDLEATVAGSARVLHELNPVVDATIRWQEWTVADIRSNVASIRVTGTKDDYQLEYRLNVEDAAGRSADIDGSAQGNLLGVQAFRATAASVVGTIDAEGSLAWSHEFALQVRLRGTALDLSGIDARIESALDADVSLRLRGDDYIGIDVHSIKGTYAQLEAQASGSIERIANAWLCKDCVAQLGHNQLSASGSMEGDSVALQWSVMAPALDELWPGLAGSLDATGVIGGTMQIPHVALDATATNLTMFGGHISELVVHAKPTSMRHIDVDLTATQAGYADQALGDLTLALRGDSDKQQSTIHWVMDSITADLQLTTTITDANVAGVLEQGSIQLPVVGTWSLLQPASFGVAGSDVTLAQQAWRNGESALDLESLAVSAGNLSVNATLNHLPLSLLESYMPQDGDISGTANVAVHLRQEDTAWFGDAHVHLDGAMVRITDHVEDAIEIAVPVAEISAEFLGKGAKLHAATSISGGFTSEVDATLSALDASANIEGRLQLQGNDWYWINSFVPSLDDVKGVISADISASGPLLKPALTGSLTLSDGALVVPSLNVPLQDINIRVTGSADGSASITGSTKAGSGSLQVAGQASDLFLPSRKLEVRISGTEAEIIDWPEYHAWATPDITLIGNQKGWTVKGSLEVPRAEITVREIPEGSVSPSPDVIVIGRDESNGQTLPISGKITLIIGTSVHVQALGLDTKVDGKLDASMPRKGAPKLVGRLNLREGKFAAYGQKLTIDNGSLTFTGPIDDPLVEVRASKSIDAVGGKVEAGIELRGRAQNLESSVYSVPKMSESDALAYLVLGHPLDQASSSDGSQLNNAAIALGLGQATRITNQIGQSVGLDQLAVSGSSNETAALVAGKQLNSHLYVRYAYGVFSQVGSLLIRYRLSKRLVLEAGAAEGQSMELLYTVEKD